MYGDWQLLFDSSLLCDGTFLFLSFLSSVGKKWSSFPDYLDHWNLYNTGSERERTWGGVVGIWVFKYLPSPHCWPVDRATRHLAVAKQTNSFPRLFGLVHEAWKRETYKKTGNESRSKSWWKSRLIKECFGRKGRIRKGANRFLH